MITPEEIIKIIKESIEEDIDFDNNTSMIGGESMVDSMGLVHICLALEEKSQDDGFNFDWTSEKAMSSINSIFRSPTTLADEYNKQLKAFGK
tara:strand:+ start:112 stop:387 length:276 start_codon:yes stop_codon:yes gene_type:complete